MNTLDRVLRALNHPVRRRILRALLDRTGSASTLSKEFGLELGAVSYHLNQVLAKECEMVELVEAVPKRGALEKFYRLKTDTFAAIAPGAAGRGGSGEERPLSFEECILAAVEAIDGDAFSELPGSAWEWRTADLDAAAWREIRTARDEFNRRLEAAIVASKARDGKQRHAVVAGVAAFPAVALAPGQAS